MTRLHLPRLYAIVDAGQARASGWSVPDLARAYLEGGARLLQVRAKQASAAAYLDMCEAVVEAARPFGATIIVNDRADVAWLAGAHGVHVGQDDLPVGAVRAAFGGLAIVGLSTHTHEQVAAAEADAPDYVAVGPVFGTSTSATGYEAVGLGLVRDAARWHGDRAGAPRRPVVAIGGITLERAREVVDAGAASVAVISDLLAGGEPSARVRRYLDILGG